MRLLSRRGDVVIGGTIPNVFSSSTLQALQIISTTEAENKSGFVGTTPNQQAFVQVSGTRRKSCEVSPAGVSSRRLRGPEGPHALRPDSIEAFLVGVNGTQSELQVPNQQQLRPLGICNGVLRESLVFVFICLGYVSPESGSARKPELSSLRKRKLVNEVSCVGPNRVLPVRNNR